MIAVFLSDGSYEEYESAASVAQEGDQFCCLDAKGGIQASHPLASVLMYSSQSSIRQIAAEFQSMYKASSPAVAASSRRKGIKSLRREVT
jgi:hypothetical protein